VDVSILPITVDKIGGGLVVTNEDIDNGADKIGGLVTAVAAPIDETGGVESSGCFGLLLIVESGADVLLFWFVEFVEDEAFELDDEEEFEVVPSFLNFN
jgi:hypothetical protein